MDLGKSSRGSFDSLRCASVAQNDRFFEIEMIVFTPFPPHLAANCGTLEQRAAHELLPG
jgi:hypothetical protein